MDTLAYLEVKTELELRGYAFKLGVRMTGPRADLEARLAAAARDLGRDRFRQVFPGYERASRNWQRGLAQARRTGRPGVTPPPSGVAGAGVASRREEPAVRRATPAVRRAEPAVRGGLRRVWMAPVPAPAPARAERAALAPLSSTPVRRNSISPPSTPSVALAKRRTMSVGSPDPRFVCKVCLDHEVEMVVMPCGHLCLCEQCAMSLLRRHVEARASLLREMWWNVRMDRMSVDPPCPICRGPIAEAKRVFL